MAHGQRREPAEGLDPHHGIRRCAPRLVLLAILRAEAGRRHRHRHTRLDTWVQRVTGVPLEPRTTVAAYDQASEQYTLYSGTGRGVAKAQLDLAHALGVPAEQVRVLCEEMGGSFGTRNLFYPEWTLLAWAAHRIGRPVKWTCERSESFISDYQGRDLRVEAELAT